MTMRQFVSNNLRVLWMTCGVTLGFLIPPVGRTSWAVFDVGSNLSDCGFWCIFFNSLFTGVGWGLNMLFGGLPYTVYKNFGPWGSAAGGAYGAGGYFGDAAGSYAATSDAAAAAGLPELPGFGAGYFGGEVATAAGAGFAQAAGAFFAGVAIGESDLAAPILDPILGPLFGM